MEISAKIHKRTHQYLGLILVLFLVKGKFNLYVFVSGGIGITFIMYY